MIENSGRMVPRFRKFRQKKENRGLESPVPYKLLIDAVPVTSC
jgi:hypothetical protein